MHATRLRGVIGRIIEAYVNDIVVKSKKTGDLVPVRHTPRVLMQGRKKTDSYKNSHVILLELVLCNPTRTPAL
jgi:hypothetical protein